VVIGLWIISAIIVLAFGVYSVWELISFYREPRVSQLVPDSQQVEPEDFDSSSSTDSGSADDIGSQTTEPTTTPEAMPATEQAVSEITIRTYNPGTDSSLPSFTEEAEYKSDQSSSEYLLYEGNFPANTSAILVMGWCSIDQDTLNENMSGIQMAGMFDNEVIPQNSWTQENAQVENKICRYFRAVVEGLGPGIHHYIWSTSYNNPVNDGWETFPPGNYIRDYVIEVGGQ